MREASPAQALDAIGLRAQLVVVDDAAELGDARRERGLAVLVEEEFRVGEPRAQHALVALDDRRRIVRLDVADQQEAMRELARVVGQREVFLVLLHGQDQAFLRHGEEGGVECAGVNGRPFDQRGDFVEQRVGHDDLRAARPRLQQAGDDLRAALAKSAITLPSAASVGS